jgi:hypothetical protein
MFDAIFVNVNASSNYIIDNNGFWLLCTTMSKHMTRNIFVFIIRYRFRHQTSLKLTYSYKKSPCVKNFTKWGITLDVITSSIGGLCFAQYIYKME